MMRMQTRHSRREEVKGFCKLTFHSLQETSRASGNLAAAQSRRAQHPRRLFLTHHRGDAGDAMITLVVLVAAVTAAATAPTQTQPTGHDVALTTAASFALVFTSAAGISTASGVVNGASLLPALKAGAQSGQRWGRVSAGFNGGRSIAQWQGAPELAAMLIGGAIGGAAGATALSKVPVRSATFVGFVLAYELAGPHVLPLAKRGRDTLNANLARRRELFARQSAPKKLSGGASDGASGGGPPWVRVQRFVDGLNAELGHGTDGGPVGGPLQGQFRR